MRITAMLAVVLLAAVATAAPAAIIVVDPSGGGSFTTIQPAIDAATPGDTVALMDHVYTGTGNRDLDMRGKAITVCSQSGNRDACIIDCEGAQSSPHRAFRLHLGEGPNTVIRGLTIRNAYTTTGLGAISCEETSATIEECLFLNNRAGEYGGAVGVQSPSEAIRIQSCRFEGNLATSLASTLYLMSAAPIEVVSCQFVENNATVCGPVYCEAMESSQFTDCLFESNSSMQGSHGALKIRLAGGNLTVTGSQFVSNYSIGVGAVWVRGVGNAYFDRCTFRDNIGENGVGALTFDGDLQLHLESCTIVRNGEQRSLAGGEGSVLTVSNCVLAFNMGQADVSLCWVGEISCADLYGQQDGWYGIADPTGTAGNIREDPLFCDLEGGDLTLHADSPCAPNHDPRCGLIGAWPVGCGPTARVASEPTDPVQSFRIVPNPTSGSCRIHWTAAQSATANIEVVTAAGRIVRTLRTDAGASAAGRPEWLWDGRDADGRLLPGGVYWVRPAGQADLAASRVVLRR